MTKCRQYNAGQSHFLGEFFLATDVFNDDQTIPDNSRQSQTIPLSWGVFPCNWCWQWWPGKRWRSSSTRWTATSTAGIHSYFLLLEPRQLNNFYWMKKLIGQVQFLSQIFLLESRQLNEIDLNWMKKLWRQALLRWVHGGGNAPGETVQVHGQGRGWNCHQRGLCHHHNHQHCQILQGRWWNRHQRGKKAVISL